MTDEKINAVVTALQSFWSQFGIPAFQEGTVPDEMPDGKGGLKPVTMPYITYRVIIPDWSQPASTFARVWYRSTSYNGIYSKVSEISEVIGRGTSIKVKDFGLIWLFKDTNFFQYMPDETGDGNIKIAYLSLIEHVFM